MMGFSGPRIFSVLRWLVLLSSLACRLPFGLEGSITCLEEKISDKRDEIQMKVDGYDTCRDSRVGIREKIHFVHRGIRFLYIRKILLLLPNNNESLRC